MKRHRLAFASFLSAAVLCIAPAHAAFPERPVRLIVPFPPGGVNDISSRLVANQLNAAWGRPVIIDNRGGAGGNIGAEIAAKANPDGYTLFIVSSGCLRCMKPGSRASMRPRGSACLHRARWTAASSRN